MSVPWLSTSNPIRSLTRLRVRLQTSSESLREDKQGDPERSRSCSRCYRPAVSLLVCVHVGEFASTQYCVEVSGRVGTLRGSSQDGTAERKQNNLQSAFYIFH